MDLKFNMPWTMITWRMVYLDYKYPYLLLQWNSDQVTNFSFWICYMIYCPITCTFGFFCHLSYIKEKWVMKLGYFPAFRIWYSVEIAFDTTSGKHTIFRWVSGGMEVIKRLRSVQTDNNDRWLMNCALWYFCICSNIYVIVSMHVNNLALMCKINNQRDG